jgi:hypothetical protein
LAYAHTLDACDVEFVIAISVTVDSNGKPILYENGVAKITGSNGHVGNGDAIAVRLVGKTVSLLVSGTYIGGYNSLVLTTGSEFKVVSLGTAGSIGSVELWPYNMKPYLPKELE